MKPNLFSLMAIAAKAAKCKGRTLQTLFHPAGFAVEVDRDAFVFVPEKSGTRRKVAFSDVAKVCDCYVRTQSMIKSDYDQITRNWSYLLVLIDLWKHHNEGADAMSTTLEGHVR